tara:strand:- start:2613 stop:2960 length:348 start_codon:yes stop_codon:yes gene_type:complete
MFHSVKKSIINIFRTDNHYKYELSVYILNKDDLVNMETNSINKIINYIEENRSQLTFIQFKFYKNENNYSYERFGFTLNDELQIIPIRDTLIDPNLITELLNKLRNKNFKKIIKY